MNPSGNSFSFLAVFLGGVVVSFSPCVYPFIPISIGLIGINPDTSRVKGLVLSFIYVTGIAITYSALGVLASLSGTVFGIISSYQISNVAVGIIVVLFGLFMLDLIKIPLPAIIKPAVVKRKRGYLSVLFLGLASGLIMSPCVTPVLGAILTHLAKKKDILYGMTLLLIFAYGMGLSLILAGTFSSVLINLPKPGKWLLYVKIVSGIILIATGVYFIFLGVRR